MDRQPEHRQRVLMTGASGLIGSALREALAARGHQVVALHRTAGPIPPPQEGVLVWDPSRGLIDSAHLEGFDLVIHLAGENLARRRWSAAQKRRLVESRCRDTWLLAQAMAQIDHPPKVWIGASAVGFYGHSDRIVDEEAPRGDGFLAELCEEWERATDILEKRGTRVIHARQGVVLTPSGGFLRQMLPLFKVGLGGYVGSGAQWMSWISREDLMEAFFHIWAHPTLAGPINITAPFSVTHREWAETLARVLHRPCFCRCPAFLARCLLGEMAEELILRGTRAVPRRLEETGYQFLFPRLLGLFESYFS